MRDTSRTRHSCHVTPHMTRHVTNYTWNFHIVHLLAAGPFSDLPLPGAAPSFCFVPPLAGDQLFWGSSTQRCSSNFSLLLMRGRVDRVHCVQAGSIAHGLRGMHACMQVHVGSTHACTHGHANLQVTHTRTPRPCSSLVLAGMAPDTLTARRLADAWSEFECLKQTGYSFLSPSPRQAF